MTQIRTTAAALVVFAALAMLMSVLGSATGQEMTSTAAAATVEVPMPVENQQLVADELFTVAFGAGVDFTEAQALEVLMAADRVCEGMTADVPVMVMADALVAQQGLDDTAARDFVNWVGVNRCAPVA